MKIVVCIKQVPGSNRVSFDPITHNLVREGMDGRMNPFDENAIEAAVRLREQVGGEVILLSMGPDAAKETLHDGMAMGADSAYLLSSRAFAGSDTLATGYVLAQAIRKIGGVDLTLFGRQAVDADTGQVGPIVATELDQPQATFAEKIQPLDAQHLVVDRDLGAETQSVQLTLPAVITVRAEANQPRYESPVAIQQSLTKPLTTWTDQDLTLDVKRIGQAGSPTIVRKVYAPQPTTRAAKPLPQDPQAAARELLNILQAQGLL
ncbi:electron transfer flavoprotein subunit beta/FixA family protein [Lacticaseibacillus camelliae]|uniref:Electron transfer flavoprotein small subunit n=1 Tax=Lacticaseibacillus camelliae DSM 22697 = JCM 13995 TaxID=1423730 RepID=A0A0R2F7K7_9LACO|nr:electron transfer flavoprotein subunit beta/FixA family protein [Lacticaseibacillus camelliae]KRN21543.1 electron transfer flavoprotein subunit alpha beta [Lacticaseibacillus camelliae DSM 22697 = JCM 13995]